MDKLEAYEKEWYVYGCDDTNEVVIYTRSRSRMNKCIKAGYTEIARDEWSRTYKTHKNNITFRTEAVNKPKKTITDEHKKKLIEGKNKSNETK